MAVAADVAFSKEFSPLTRNLERWMRRRWCVCLNNIYQDSGLESCILLFVVSKQVLCFHFVILGSGETMIYDIATRLRHFCSEIWAPLFVQNGRLLFVNRGN